MFQLTILEMLQSKLIKYLFVTINVLMQLLTSRNIRIRLTKILIDIIKILLKSIITF